MTTETPDCSRCKHPYLLHRNGRRCQELDCRCLLYRPPSHKPPWKGEHRVPRRYADSRKHSKGTGRTLRTDS